MDSLNLLPWREAKTCACFKADVFAFCIGIGAVALLAEFGLQCLSMINTYHLRSDQKIITQQQQLQKDHAEFLQQVQLLQNLQQHMAVQQAKQKNWHVLWQKTQQLAAINSINIQWQKLTWQHDYWQLQCSAKTIETIEQYQKQLQQSGFEADILDYQPATAIAFLKIKLK